MQVRREIEKFQVEQSFPEDLICVLQAAVKRRYWGWPLPKKLGTWLDKFKVKLSVGYSDLDKTGMFPSHESIVEFLKFYQRFDFNEPETVTKYGTKPRSTEDAVAQQVEQRIARMFGLEPITLKDMTMSRGNKGRARSMSSGSSSAAATESSCALSPMAEPWQDVRSERQRRVLESQSVKNLALLRRFSSLNARGMAPMNGE